jgi:SAM-dependent MidA family methyltransferase
MELALYDAEHGYYARAAQRSGKEGDFYTSVDVSALFGATIAEQLAEMWQLLLAGGAKRVELVEAGAGNARLSRDILDAIAERHPHLYPLIDLKLVERSASAREAQRHTLGPHRDRLVSSSDRLPGNIRGAIVANELLDALPVHVIEATASGLCEVRVAERDGVLVEELQPAPHPQCVALPSLEPGQRAELGLHSLAWIRDAALSLERGFVLLFDYFYRPSPDFFCRHPAGTLMTYRRHHASGSAWLQDPGERDITSHVNVVAIQSTGEAHGFRTLGIVDQTYFLLQLGLPHRLPAGDDPAAIRQRLAGRTLLMPGGLGDTMKVMIFGKEMGTPELCGLRGGRLT